MPVVPILILLLGSTGLIPFLKMGVPQAMIIGAILTLVVTRTKPKELSDAFFDGMGMAYGKILGIIISAGVFVSGLTTIGLVKWFIDIMLNNPAVVKLCAALGPFVLGLLVGSGDAATFAFNEAITPYAPEFGMSQVRWAAWRRSAARWGARCRQSLARPSSALVSLVSTRWRSRNAMPSRCSAR